MARAPGKYRNVKAQVGDLTFDSQAEAKRYWELLMLFKAGHIRNLERQPRLAVTLNGKKVFTYIADFSYFEGQERVFEDKKGFRTPVYRLKKRIVEAYYGVKIRET